MTRTRRRLRAAVSLGLLGLAAPPGCRRADVGDANCPVLPPTTVVPPEAEGAAPARVVSGTTPLSSRRFTLSADTTFRLGDTAVVRLCGVQLVVFDSAGREGARLRSESGEYDPRTQVLVARDHVVVEAPDQRRLRTEELRFAPQEDRLWSPVPTTLQRPGIEVRVDSFTSDGRFEEVRAFRARGTFRWD